MRILRFLTCSLSLLFTGTLAIAQAAPSGSNDSCERLAKVEIPNASITATAVPAGGFVGPAQNFTGRDLSGFYKKLPAFCRVIAQAKPTADSDIVIEIWLPVSGWNGRLQGLGNGGFAGLIDTFELGAALQKGYAATATDAGHTGSPIDAGWALGHPEKIADFGYRGIHEMTRVAKALIQQFYGSAAKHAYFAACSDGGREALMEAQRFPDDFDGILAGAPANNWTGLLSLAVFDTQTLTASPAAFIPPAKVVAIASAVDTACDKLDGVGDGILNDPRQCHFDPASMECKNGEDNDKCLTSAQVGTLKTIYSGLPDSIGKQIFPGYLPGAESGLNGWTLWITGPSPARSLMAAFGIGYFSDMVYGKADWSYKSFNPTSGIQTAKEKTAAMLDATNPDLSAFRAHGGKLILYHGWNDPAIPALSTVNYYDSVIAKMGSSNVDSFARLYMLPGVQHCGGGPGADSFGQSADWPATDPEHNVRIALENWVEKGTAPPALIATKVEGEKAGEPTMTRPMCPYPQSVQYKGSGDTNSAESFVCANPKK
jgi:feruloyl esterase